jgi:membrane associated rhomboid family serine protease
MPVRSRVVTLDRYKLGCRPLLNMFGRVPLFTLLIIAVCTLIFVMQLLNLAPSASSVCLSPALVLGRFQVYRMLVDPFFHGGFLHLALNMFALYMLATDIEGTLGTLGMTHMVLLVIIPFAGVAHTLLAYVLDALTGLSTRNNCASKLI